MTVDRIEKRIVLRAPLSRVWRAISDAEEFGLWFGFELDGRFAPGQPVRGKSSGPLNEAAIVAHQQSVGVEPSKVKPPAPDAVFCTVEQLEPERYFSFRWIPYAIDAEADPDNEPTTLVEFTLTAVAGGTELTIVESGFERVPAHRRRRAFLMNEGGWAAQVENVKRYVESA